MKELKIIGYEDTEDCEEQLVKANGNPVDAYTFRLLKGDFFEGETVMVETVLDGKQYTRKVRSDSWDLYITIKGNKCYWDSDRMD